MIRFQVCCQRIICDASNAQPNVFADPSGKKWERFQWPHTEKQQLPKTKIENELKLFC